MKGREKGEDIEREKKKGIRDKRDEEKGEKVEGEKKRGGEKVGQRRNGMR